MRISAKLLVATAAAGLVATGGSAFTAGNTVNGNNVAGYGSATVSGATTKGIEHTLNADGSQITSTLLTFETDLGAATATTTYQVKAGFDGTALESCTVTLSDIAGGDTATCAYAGTGYATSTATAFKVSVS